MAISDKVKQDFQTLTGKTVAQFIDELKIVPAENIADYVIKHEAWFNVLLEKMPCRTKSALSMKVRMKSYRIRAISAIRTDHRIILKVSHSI